MSQIASVFAALLLFTSVFAQTDRQSRIVGGNSVGLGQIPYQVSLRQWRQNFHFCGGALISNRWITTAASCVYGRADDSLDIVAGIVNLNSRGQSSRSCRIVVHAGFNPMTFIKTTFNHNIAVVRAVLPFFLNRFVSSIPMGSTILRDFDIGVISGFGATTVNGGPNSPILQSVAVFTADMSKACIVDGVHVDVRFSLCGYNVNIYDHTRPAGFCTTDVGGPLVRNSDELIGIASWNEPCARNRVFDIYVRVSEYRPWIGSVTGV